MRTICGLVLLTLWHCTSVFADSLVINAWTNPVSGYWEELKWSLGARPGPGQTVMITNQGWKAVGIGTNTTQSFPGTLDVSRVILGGYTDSFNTLLLNYAGLEVPLKAGSIIVGSNSAVTVLASVVSVMATNSAPGDISIFSLFHQGEQGIVNAHTINLGNITNPAAGSGTYNQTNGTINADAISAWSGSTFNQFDGANTIGGLALGGANNGNNSAHYSIASGSLTAGEIELERGDFNQTGGSVTAGLSIGAATYTLSAGTLRLPGITIPNAHYGQQNPGGFLSADATLLQTGGTNFCNGVLTAYHEHPWGVSVPFVGPGRYILSNGVLCVSSTVHSWMGDFQQWGGWHTNAGIAVDGGVFPNWVIYSGSFTLGGGTLITPSITVNYGDFTQSGGTNRVSGDIGVGIVDAESSFTLTGGLLTDLNTSVDGSNPGTPGSFHAIFTQSGGTHIVTNLLRLSGLPPSPYGRPSYTVAYFLSNGGLSAANIQIDNEAFFEHDGGTLTTSGLLTLGYGTWNEKTSGQQFGQLLLSAPAGSNANFSLPSGNCVVRFASSSAQPWASGAILSINNWHGSTSGGGATQLYFGSNASGLTAQQLAQVQFQISGSAYPATILSTGEVVPASVPPGLVNSWINPGSGVWEDSSSWSLGVRPNQSQSVMITNSGSKAVAINPVTPVNFPDSMTVSNLTIRGASNTTNTLLLNYFGTAVPLTVSNGLTLQDNARILNFSSGLAVQSGTIIVTNAQMIQDGGFVRTTNTTMYLQNAQYDLTNGVFESGQVTIGLPGHGRFNQYGGTAVISDLRFGRGPYFGAGGNYALYGGELSLPGGLMVTGDNDSSSSYLQAGGTNRTTQVVIEPGLYGNTPGFTLNGGLLADNNVSVMGDDFDSATLNQNGGTHVITNTLSISGGSTHGQTIRPGKYNLNAGTLFAGAIELNANQGDSVFVQTNGTTIAGTFYAHSLGYYGSFNDYITMAGGSLTCSNFTLDDGRGSFSQSGGALVVSNLLTITGYRDLNGRYYGLYTFTGGTVTASNINIAADWIIGDGSTNRISNPGFFSLSHTLQIGSAVEQLGRFILASSSNATINLAGSASRLSFANSSGQSWTGGATLVVANWNGNLSGGGAEQLKFGTNQSGLTPNQLAQIQFANPAGLAAGNYPARILATGEVVPTQLLTLSRSGNTLTLTWGPGWTLQSSTNVTGPYQDVQGANSPYMAPMNSPRQFFRLRQ